MSDIVDHILSDKEPMSVTGKIQVTDRLIEYLRRRELEGIKTYGTTLETFNGRNAVHDLLDELLDGAQYAVQWLLEREELINLIRAQRTALIEKDKVIEAQSKLIKALGGNV